MNLSKLQSVNLIEVWKKETEFTNWLIKAENLKLLSEELGIGIINLIQTEGNPIDNLKYDILAEGEDNKKIIIENQFRITDHDHLGKAITYASGVDAEIVIWIAEYCSEAHKKAVDFLNSHTSDKLNFFLVRIELWKIDDSNPSPKFEVISQPNDWEKMLKASQQKELSPIRSLQYNFWDEFKEYCIKNRSTLQIQGIHPKPQNLFDIRYGDSKSNIRLLLDFSKINGKFQNGKIWTSILITDKDKSLYSKFYSNREEIETKLNTKLTWNPSPEDKTVSKIMIHKEVNDITNRDEWEKECFSWLKTTAEKFSNTFKEYI